MANLFQPDIVHSSELDNIPIMDGRIIRTYDQYDEYFDYDGERCKIGDIISVDTYNDLRKIENPIKGKFYYVKDEELAQLYYFNGSKFIKTSGYTHPVYSLTPGTYRCIQVNQLGHVYDANNDILPISLGGTGVDNLDSLRENLNIPNTDDITTLSNKVDENTSSISEINNNMTEMSELINQNNSSLNEEINTLKDDTDNKISELNNQIDSITNSYYIRDVESSEWILDNTDNSYYIMILKSTYGLRESFPITSIYLKTDDGYNMSHGIFDNKDYVITVNDSLDITIKTTNPFSCKIIINTI